MLRALGIFGLTGGFLLISQQLRQLIADGFGFGNNLLQDYSPYSYVLLGVLAIFAVTKAVKNVCALGRS